MVTRRLSRTVGAALGAAALSIVMVFSAGSAEAHVGGMSGGDSSSSSSSSDSGSGGGLSSGSQSSGGDTGTVTGTVQHCSLYATSSSFGLSCAGGGGDAVPVKKLLDGDPVPTCWDIPVSDDDAYSHYHKIPDTGFSFYLLSCITGLDVNATLYNQPGLKFSQKLIEIRDGSGNCPPPFTDAQKSGDDTSCVLVLIGHQHTVTDYIGSNGAQIPGITLVTYPSTVVRTQVDTAYVDKATCDDCISPTETAHKSAGGVTMYAKMVSFKIQPYGPNGKDQKECDGTANVLPTDTREDKPQACWYKYTHSSFDQPNHVYPFQAVATWQVIVEGQGVFATFHKYAALKLPVVDVQTQVIAPQTNGG